MSAEAKQGENTQAVNVPVVVQRKAGPASTAVKHALETGEHGNREVNRKLTRREQGVLRVLMDPANAEKTGVEKYKLAGVSCTHWHSILKDPWIKQKQIELTQEFVAQHIAPILEASRQTAVTPGRDGWQDRRWLAEVGGFYVPRRQVEQHTTGHVAIGIVGIDTKDI